MSLYVPPAGATEAPMIPFSESIDRASTAQLTRPSDPERVCKSRSEMEGRSGDFL